MTERERPSWYEEERSRILARIHEIEYEAAVKAGPDNEQLSALDYGDPIQYIRKYGPITGGLTLDGDHVSRRMTPAERDEMERATSELHQEFDAIISSHGEQSPSKG